MSVIIDISKDYDAVIVKYRVYHINKYIAPLSTQIWDKNVMKLTDKREKWKLLDEMTQVERLRAENQKKEIELAIFKKVQ